MMGNLPKKHARDIVAVDMFVVPTIRFPSSPHPWGCRQGDLIQRDRNDSDPRSASEPLQSCGPLVRVLAGLL